MIIRMRAKDITLGDLIPVMHNQVTGRRMLQIWQEAGFEVDERSATNHLDQMHKAQVIKIDEMSKEPILDQVITLAHP